MKGIILSGGLGTRLRPLTKVISKQLLPVYDKPMIYYPLSVLMLAGIKEILIITDEYSNNLYQKLLGDGGKLGIKIFYKIQEKPRGLAESFIIGEDFIKDDNVCLILGDNIFFGHGLVDLLTNAINKADKYNYASVFAYHVPDPERYGVIEFENNIPISIEEKPKKPKSNYAIVGLYFYPNCVIKKSKLVEFSHRKELEISSLNLMYLQQKKLNVEILKRGFAWFDTGTHDSLIDASNFIQNIEKRQGLKVACIEYIAYKMGYITLDNLKDHAKKLSKTNYGDYLNLRIKELK